jgi:hypothetical protein
MNFVLNAGKCFRRSVVMKRSSVYVPFGILIDDMIGDDDGLAFVRVARARSIREDKIQSCTNSRMPLTDGERYSTRIPVYNVSELRFRDSNLTCCTGHQHLTRKQDDKLTASASTMKMYS